MRKFFSSWGASFLVVIVLTGVTLAAYVLLKPTGAGVSNEQLQTAGMIAGYAVGPVMGLLSLILISILRLLRRMFRLHEKQILAPILDFCAVLPWLILSWQLTAEPRFTPFAEIIIDFVARPMLWGSLAASGLTFIAFFVVLFTKKK